MVGVWRGGEAVEVVFTTLAIGSVGHWSTLPAGAVSICCFQGPVAKASRHLQTKIFETAIWHDNAGRLALPCYHCASMDGLRSQ
jgi:hypothetical protein